MIVDLTPARLDLVLYAGDATAVTINAWADEAKTTPADLSDRTWTAQWRHTRSSDTAVDLVVEDTDAATGTLIVRFSETQTAEFAKTGVWDIQGITNGGEPDTLVGGSVTTKADVTR